MKNTVNANEFLSALTKATKINKGKQPLPILQEVKMSFENGKCILTSSNLEQWGTFSISAYGDSFTFIPQNTASIVKACKFFKGDLVLDYDKEKNTVQFSSNGKSCKVLCCDVKDYPEMPTPTAEHTYHTNADELFNRYGKIKYAISKEDSRPIYTGVCFNRNQMVALDGYRMAINSNEKLKVDSKFVVPQRTMNLLDSFDKSDIEIEVSKTHIVFKNSEVTIMSRLLEGEYLDYDLAIPKNNNEIYTVNVKQYVNELKYLKEFDDRNSKRPVKFDNGTLSLHNSNGEFKAHVDIKGNAKSVYGYNLHYMMDVLSQFKHIDNITIKTNSSVQPIVLTDNKDNLALICPVRLKDEYVA
jgi:DNA polymerase-3 subunit beta